VTVIEQKTAGINMEPNRTKPWFSGSCVTVFLKFQKWPSPITNICNNNLINGHDRLLPLPFEVTVW